MPRSRVAPGDRFGRWTVQSTPYLDGNHTRALCRCDCGTERAVLLHSMRCGGSTSCGCAPRGRRKPSIVVEVGQRFGSWTVVTEVDRGSRGERRVLCECACGRRKPVYLHNLRNGYSSGCQGCASRALHTKHGESRSAEYSTWIAMKQRCRTHPRYAGRGIRVCDRWTGPNGFKRFLADVGRRPSDKHSIVRIDNDGHYEPGNVRWETAAEQARNTCRSTVVVRGKRMTMREIGERHGISRQAIEKRLSRGWTPEECWDHGKGETPPRLSRRTPSSYRCGSCGEHGHNRRTCPERQDAAA